MKYLSKAIIVVAVLCIAFAVTANADEQRAYTVADMLNIRSQPSTEANIVGQYPYGSTLNITGAIDSWYQINYNSSTAYVHSDYVAFAPTAPSASSTVGQSIVDTAKQYIGTPYVYGGMSPSGFDCSGFVKYIYSMYGANLNRTAADQSNNGYWVARESMQPGDIICFSSSVGGSYIGHVGIYVGNNSFIHSPYTGRSVEIETLNGHYGDRFYCARRIF